MIGLHKLRHNTDSNSLVKVCDVSNRVHHATNGLSLMFINTDTYHHVGRNNPETKALRALNTHSL